ncbi:hypothetical protein N7532_003475 [Penicillium argentinense]|uniref:Zn(2)-C6 fungal-type domain-containing protein n=1 Tax=Penicillium argentinense TaxID=1131581 RepID=A0A9W9KEK2_9EURO|nr:uncharacterized protein N7532_003475 [Penicillium argentinense]KAJ5102946.1 hypothetical protein N7532_003475 [Penicillium argentinense]
MSRMPHPEGHQLPPGTHGGYEPPPAWRPPYAPHSHFEDRRPSSTQAVATLPPPNYAAMPGRELAHLHHIDGSSKASPKSARDLAAFRPARIPPVHRLSTARTARYRRNNTYIRSVAGAIALVACTDVRGGSPPPPYGPEFYQNPAYGHRARKAARAQQACDQCRTRKAKCDEGRPECSHCKENGLKCVYKEIPTHKQEKSIQPILTSLMHFKDEVLQDLRRMLNAQEHNTNQLTHILAAQQSSLSTTDKSRLSQGAIAPPPPAGHTDENGSARSSFADGCTTAVSFDDPALKDDNEGELSIPLEHTTAAHKLLMWPAIKKLLSPQDYDKDYVMAVEGKRGVTSIFGRGENSFSADGSFLPGWQPKEVKSQSGDHSTPKSSGVTNTAADPDLGSWAGLALQDDDAEISRMGIFRLGKKTVRQYAASYIKHIHQLHPFLHQQELESKIATFIDCYCSVDSLSFCRDKKRKRSAEDVDGSGRDGWPRPPVGLNIDNAIILLVLALGAICETKSALPGPVMAKRPNYLEQHIPGPPAPPVPVPEPPMHPANGFPSPANSDSALPSHSHSYYSQPPPPPPFDNASQSFPSAKIENGREKSPKPIVPVPRPTPDTDQRPKNYKVIPGLALYGYAIQILAFLHSGIHLQHVQANLLAGLYAGQLAHPFSSHSHIHKAAWACQVLVASKEYKALAAQGGGPAQDLDNFAYWTCLQLESDLLAELDIPASGISRSEGLIALPKGRWTIPLPNNFDDPRVRMMLFYSSQIHLRKVLNRVHTDLYKVSKQGQARWSSSVQEALSQNLDLWRNSLPDVMNWKDEDPPAEDINSARMRAKYYGARYIIHRPLLYHALHYGGSGARVSAKPPAVDSPTSSVTNSQQMSPSMTNTSHRAPNMTRMISDIGTVSSNPAAAFPNGWTPPVVNLRDLPSKLRRACKVCVDSAILSTQAFDGIEDPFSAMTNPYTEEPYRSAHDPLGGARMEDQFVMDRDFSQSSKTEYGSKNENSRLVVTNIFGTAHAQFGNLLVLSATYMSSLSELVDRDILKRLLKRTIRFLIRSEHISPTLRADARILTEIFMKIFHHSPNLDSPDSP